MSMDWIGKSQALKLGVRNFVNGGWSEGGGDSLAKHSPRDGRLLCRFGACQTREVEEAVATARRAFEDGRWSRLPTERRKEVLHRLASLIDAYSEELALLECLDVGKPISDALSFDVPSAAAIIRFNAEAANKFYGKVYGVDQSSLSYQLRRPIGVAAGIVGWNFPLLLAAGKIGPALATGNSLVLKPSELTSFSAARIAELAIAAGVPEGVFNVIHGGGGVGSALAHHSGVDLVSFTGSTQTGKKLLIAAGQSNMKRLILECGGKAPNIVFDDSPNLEAVADAVVARAFYNQGEVCSASSRLLVQESIKDEFLPILIGKASALSPGDPLRAETKFGAVVSEEHKQKVLAYIDSGEKEGARRVYQSNASAPHPGGFYIPPVVFDHVSPGQKIAQEEIFGPVLSVISFRDEEAAIQIANGTIYGLSAILWTKDLGRAHRVTQGVKAGWVVVNATAQPTGGPGLGVISVGGHKESGVGVEGGLEGLEHYTSKTAVQFFV
jgi:acyl-CoA reductase-like NAD-dependent aldehyde dehydrogenase